LPIAGGALGTFVGGPAGGMIGSKLASMAGDAFGLEWGELSPEDRDFEVARRYVRFAGEAAKKAAMAPPQADPQAVVKDALVDAARKFAPGLLAPAAGAGVAPGIGATVAAPPSFPAAAGQPAPAGPACTTCGATPCRHKRQGKWIRRGRHIILLGV
jgi:hypothetical protein